MMMKRPSRSLVVTTMMMAAFLQKETAHGFVAPSHQQRGHQFNTVDRTSDPVAASSNTPVGDFSLFLNPSTAGAGIKSNKRSTASTSQLQAWPLERDPAGMAPNYPLAEARIIVTAATTFLTWFAQAHLRHSTTGVLASSALTLIASVCLDRRLGQAAFCGSLAGMCSTALVPNYQFALTLGVITSFLYEVIIHYRNAFLGIGGRLGATAFLASSLVASIRGVSTGVTFKTFKSLLSPFTAIQRLDTTAVWSMMMWHAFGSMAVIALREASDDSSAADPVRASAVVGLLGALLLPDKAAALALYGGTFVGMSLPSRLLYGDVPGRSMRPNRRGLNTTTAKLLGTFALAGAFGGFINALTVSLRWWTAASFGGKAGLCSFLGCLSFRGMANTKMFVRAIKNKVQGRKGRGRRMSAPISRGTPRADVTISEPSSDPIYYPRPTTGDAVFPRSTPSSGTVQPQWLEEYNRDVWAILRNRDEAKRWLDQWTRENPREQRTLSAWWSPYEGQGWTADFWDYYEKLERVGTLELTEQGSFM